MIRFSARTNKLLAVVALLSGATAVNCSKGTSNSSTDVGSLHLALTLPDATTLDSVTYTVKASDGTTTLATGPINTSDHGATPSVDVSVIASMNDTVNLHGTTSAGVICDGTSAAFTVVAGAPIMIGVNLICGGSANHTASGSLIVNGTVVIGNNCPVLNSWMASPLQTSTAGQIDVSAAATDLDTSATPPQTLTYAWTATAGTFVAPAAATTKYSCSVAGTQTLTVTATDNYSPTPCAVVQTFTVNCVSLTCGNGALDSGEQCDSSAATDPNKTNCDANCHLICGNGTLQAGEDCDPPVAGVCTAACKFAPINCGDSIVQHGEQCDPPNGSTCSATCQTIVQDVPDFSASCQTCENQAIVDGNAVACDPALMSVTGSAHFGCLGFTGAAQTACLNLLSCLRTNHCTANLVSTPPGAHDSFATCFCGTLSSIACLSNNGSPTAACYAQYNTALAAVNVPGATQAVTTLFTNPLSPIGIADNIAKCDIDAPCNTAATCGAF
jgi:hypothetical protein